MPRPTTKRVGLGTGAELGLAAIRLLRAGPIATWDLAATLDCSREAVDELLGAIKRAGFPLRSERRGREILHSLPPDMLLKVMP